MEFTVTAKVQIIVSPDQRQMLDETLEAYRQASQVLNLV